MAVVLFELALKNVGQVEPISARGDFKTRFATFLVKNISENAHGKSDQTTLGAILMKLFPISHNDFVLSFILNSTLAAMDGSLKENAAKYSTLNEGSDWLTEAEGDVPPIGAIVGGILGQEAIKAIGLKEEPISNWFLFNGIHMRGNTIRL